MKRFFALGTVLALVSACGMTSADRESYRDAALDAATVAVEALQAVGVAPDDVSPDVIRYANAACSLIEVGSPLIVQVINGMVEKHNKDAADAGDGATDVVTVGEFVAGLDGICDLIGSLAAPEPVPDPEVAA